MRGETDAGMWKGITSTRFHFRLTKRYFDMSQRKVIWSVFGLTMYEPTKQAGKDPCENCWARDLCDKDQCGVKDFPLFEDNI